TTEYFDPGTKPFMVNYRVEDLEELLERLRGEGETVIDGGYESRDGRFAWVIDPDGQKVELWEPADPEPSEPEPTGAGSRGPVRGLGGVFFRSPDPAALKSWYGERLGIEPGEDGYVGFRLLEPDGLAGHTAWEIFPSDTDYFDSGGVSSPHDFMVNFRVEGLAALLERLRAGGVWVDPDVQTYEYGTFGWIQDPMGARVELWEPPEAPFG
ncbi:MAG: VOC family protein, partial [Gemmatimonadota bacterium]|nr:VOC family protein [Gemmatimonadota bacterium]